MGTNKIRHIGVFISEGESPEMNAALYAIAKAYEAKDIKLSGIRIEYVVKQH
tara:strand:- start:3031 stop:3186 length:156 start_codon:yes stop_codon:yes gene_type:complete